MGQAVREHRRVGPGGVRVIGGVLRLLPRGERGGPGRAGELGVHLVPAVEGVDHVRAEPVGLGDAVGGAGVVPALGPAAGGDRDPRRGQGFHPGGVGRAEGGVRDPLADVPDAQLGEPVVDHGAVRVHPARPDVGLHAQHLDQRVRHPGRDAGAGDDDRRGVGDGDRRGIGIRAHRGDHQVGAGRGARRVEPGAVDGPAGLGPPDTGDHDAAVGVPGDGGELLRLRGDQGHGIGRNRDGRQQLGRRAGRGIAAGGPDVTTILVESFPRPAPAEATM
jgi:hypothetical protein